MKLQSRLDRGVAVLEVSGKMIGAHESSERFRSYFKKIIAAGQRKVVVDLSGVSWATSQGIGMLIGAYTSMKNVQGMLVLANPGTRVRDILRVTRLINIFDVYDSETEAVDHLVEQSIGGASAPRQRPDTAFKLQPLRMTPLG